MEDIINIIQKKLKNERLSSLEEKAFVAWVSSAENSDAFNDYKKVWDLSGTVSETLNPDIDLQWRKFKSLREKPQNIKRHIQYFINSKFAAAAVTILVLGLVVLLKYFSGASDVYFSNNSTLDIKLPDNSLIVLNKNSSLKVSKQFNKKNRVVILKGEAFFDVTKDFNNPFVVEIDQNLNVTVLGTKFNLRAYNHDRNIELKVLSGKVLFENNNNNVVVEKGMEVNYSSETNSFTELKPIDVNMLAWKTQEFNFDNTPINEIVIALERFLGKRIELPKNTSNIRYTGAFDSPEDKEVAAVLALAMGWDYEITEEAIIFYTK